MESYKVYLEKRLSNPLRKQRNMELGITPTFQSPEDLAKKTKNWEDYVLRYPLSATNPDHKPYLDIRLKYNELQSHDPVTAKRYFDLEREKFINSLKKQTLGSSVEKIFEYQGVQVFLDVKNVERDFSEGSRRMNHVKKSTVDMVNYIKDLLPNIKPRILITDLAKNNYTKCSMSEEDVAYGMCGQNVIYIDQYSVDMPNVFVHEYAHYVTIKASGQSKELLVKAYKELINLYYEKMKRRKLRLNEPARISRQVLHNLSVKLGFPEYGTQNPDELFAMIIEKWKSFPNNPMTYKFKSLVKNILTRL